MQCKPYFVYERGRLHDRNNLGISIQCVLTNRGRVCFCMCADGTENLWDDNHTVNLIVHEFTQWFYEKGIPVFCKTNSKYLVYKSMVREFIMLHQKILSTAQKENRICRISLQVLMITENGYIGGSAGKVGGIKAWGRRFGRYCYLDSKEKNSLHYLGMEGFRKVRKLSGKTKRSSLFILYSQAYEDVFGGKHLDSFLKSCLNETLIEKGIREIVSRASGWSQESDFACICMKICK